MKAFFVNIFFEKSNHFCICFEGDVDVFYMDSDKKIFSRSSKADVTFFAKSKNLNFDANREIMLCDFDRLWPLLHETKRKKKLLTNEYKCIIDCWNAIEDIARTLEVKLPPYSRSKKYKIQKIYEKTFANMDIFGIGSIDLVRYFDHDEYDFRHDVLSRKERSIMRIYLTDAWKINRGYAGF